MRAFLFYLSILIVAVLLFDIASILIRDFSRLTEYGFGYLAGKILLFLLFSFVAYLSRDKSKSKKDTK